MYKIDCESKLLACDFFEKVTKAELADNIVKRCPRYEIDRTKCFSSNSSQFSWIILDISQCYN